jgi:hypothetical protein
MSRTLKISPLAAKTLPRSAVLNRPKEYNNDFIYLPKDCISRELDQNKLCSLSLSNAGGLLRAIDHQARRKWLDGGLRSPAFAAGSRN